VEAIVAYSLQDESLIKKTKEKENKTLPWYVIVGMIIIYLLIMRGGRSGRYVFHRGGGFYKSKSSNGSFSGKGGRFGGGGASGGW